MGLLSREGTIKNFSSSLFALPAAYERLRSGQYFVHYRDGDELLNRICRYLKLRGVDVDTTD